MVILMVTGQLKLFFISITISGTINILWGRRNFPESVNIEELDQIMQILASLLGIPLTVRNYLWSSTKGERLTSLYYSTPSRNKLRATNQTKNYS